MKTPEDEAFDDIARRQGGGGFQAKRQAAMDKINSEQEPVALKIMMEHSAWGGRLELSDALANIDEFYATAPPKPAQEPVARVTGVYGGRFTYDPINRATILPVGMALYAGPPQREWVGLTDQESIDIIKQNNNYLYPIKLLQAVMDALKAKNT